MAVKKMGRPKKQFDWQTLESLIQVTANQDYIAERMLIKDGKAVTPKSIATYRKRIQRALKDKYQLTFVQYKAQRMEGIKTQLIHKALERAIQGNSNTMLIFCLKNICGWSDKAEKEITAEAESRLVIQMD